MTEASGFVEVASAETFRRDMSIRLRRSAEYICIPLLALTMSALLFSVFLLAIGKSPVEFFQLVARGGFGTAFSIQNTLQRAAPLILTGLAVAIPARIGLIMIGGEGALVLGGFASAAIAIPMIDHVPPIPTLLVMAIAGAATGALWVGLAGALRHYRGVNETISTLLLTYIGIAIMNFFVEGSLRDLTNPNKPSTKPIGDAYMIGKIPGTDVHWGLAIGIVLAIALQILMTRTTFGFAARVTGGNFRAQHVHHRRRQHEGSHRELRGVGGVEGERRLVGAGRGGRVGVEDIDRHRDGRAALGGDREIVEDAARLCGAAEKRHRLQPAHGVAGRIRCVLHRRREGDTGVVSADLNRRV